MKMNWIQNVLAIQLNGVIEALQELGDIEVQRRRWNSDGRGEVSSFSEAIESLYGDSGLGDELEKGLTGLDASTVVNLKALDKALSKIAPYRKPDDIIGDPAMAEVRRLAREAMVSIRAQAKVRDNQ